MGYGYSGEKKPWLLFHAKKTGARGNDNFLLDKMKN
jgi:hypothetical protein